MSPQSIAAETLDALAKRGIRHLFVRQVVTTLVTFAGGAVLARVLSPTEFGTYAILTFIVNIFMLFGDLGLSASFIQNPASPTKRLLQVSFTIQFCLVTAVILLTWAVAQWMMQFYPSIGRNGVWLARVLSFLLYLPVLRSISAVQLEHDLNFKPIALAEGMGISLYQIIAVICALMGMGVWSFVLATLLAGIVGLLVLYRFAPWPIRLCFDVREMRRVLKAGISFQSVPVLDIISQSATPAIAGTLAGPNAVAYLGLALANSKRPLLLAESVMRVSFPHFSRLQGEIRKLHETINDYVVGLLWILVMWSGFLWTSGSPLVAIIYSDKWIPAVPALIIFAVALPMDMIIWAMGMSYRAANRNGSAVKVFAMRTILNLVLAALLVTRIGFIGIPYAYLISNVVCAVLLVYSFAPGFVAKMVRSGWWLVPCVVLAYVCGRVSAEFLAGSGSTPLPVWQFFSGAVPFVAVYLMASWILVPQGYRDRFLDLVRTTLLSGPPAAHGVRDLQTERPSGFECVVNED